MIKFPDRAEAERFFNYPYATIEESLCNAVYHKGYDVREPMRSAFSLNGLKSSVIQGQIVPSQKKVCELIGYSTGGTAIAVSGIS